MAFSTPCCFLRLGWSNGDNEVCAWRIAGIGDVVQVSSAAEADITGTHAANDAVSHQLAGAFTHIPDFTMQMSSDCFMHGANFLMSLMHFQPDVAGFQHADQVMPRLAIRR